MIALSAVLTQFQRAWPVLKVGVAYAITTPTVLTASNAPATADERMAIDSGKVDVQLCLKPTSR
jgi:hypothetical protein